MGVLGTMGIVTLTRMPIGTLTLSLTLTLPLTLTLTLTPTRIPIPTPTIITAQPSSGP